MRLESFDLRAATCVAAMAVLSAGVQAEDDPPPWNQADAIFGEQVMASAREQVLANNGGQRFPFVLFNQFEYQAGDEDAFSWNGQASWGGDIRRLWLKTEGDLESGGEDDAELQVLYSQAVAAFWNLQAGVRHDFEPDGLNHAVIALNGLAPYWFEIDASAFLSEDGDVTARVEAEYELLLTQRWILQPRIEINASASDIDERGIGSGVTDVDVGLRLRYAAKREFAPYLGIEYQAALGNTRDIVEAAGEDASDLKFLIGVRAWF